MVEHDDSGTGFDSMYCIARRTVCIALLAERDAVCLCMVTERQTVLEIWELIAGVEGFNEDIRSFDEDVTNLSSSRRIASCQCMNPVQDTYHFRCMCVS